MGRLEVSAGVQYIRTEVRRQFVAFQSGALLDHAAQNKDIPITAGPRNGFWPVQAGIPGGVNDAVGSLGLCGSQ